MLKFFRRIRESLFVDGGAKRYFFYAIGEIILVVIGILIALQINNWNEYRKDRILEKEYLSRLKEDLTFDISWINYYFLDRFEKKILCLENAKSYYQGNYVINDTTQFLDDISYGGVFGNVDWTLNKNTYSEIISTGNLRKIDSDTLRTKINNYYESVDAYIIASKNYVSGYINYVNSMKSFNPNNPKQISKFDQKFLLDHLKTEEFYRLTNLEITLANRIQDWAKIIKDNAIDLIENIDQALKD